MADDNFVPFNRAPWGSLYRRATGLDMMASALEEIELKGFRMRPIHREKAYGAFSNVGIFSFHVISGIGTLEYELQIVLSSNAPELGAERIHLENNEISGRLIPEPAKPFKSDSLVRSRVQHDHEQARADDDGMPIMPRLHRPLWDGDDPLPHRAVETTTEHDARLKQARRMNRTL